MRNLTAAVRQVVALLPPDGERESEQSWKKLLIDAKSHGLVEAPKHHW